MIRLINALCVLFSLRYITQVVVAKGSKLVSAVWLVHCTLADDSKTPD